MLQATSLQSVAQKKLSRSQSQGMSSWTNISLHFSSINYKSVARWVAEILGSIYTEPVPKWWFFEKFESERRFKNDGFSVRIRADGKWKHT